MEAIDAPAEPNRTAVLLPEVLDVRAAAPLAGELMDRRGRDLELDASNVRRLGGQCLQVLLAAESCWKAEGLGFRVLSPSSDFNEGLALLGAPAFASTPGV